MVTKRKTSKTASESKKPFTIRSADYERDFLREATKDSIGLEAVSWSVSEVDTNSYGVDGAFTLMNGDSAVTLYFDVNHYRDLPGTSPGLWGHRSESNHETLCAVQAFRDHVNRFADAFELAVTDYETMRLTRNNDRNT